MRVLVSGIGRSGTTMMYQQIGLMMRDAFEAPRYRYEPYLWNLNPSNTKLASYGPESLSARGMQVHQNAPLFLDGAHPVHDAFLWSLYGGAATLPGDPEIPDAWLAKIIRGSGRLESYLQAFPDLKVVICLRNPLDTLNSSLGMFSFTGEEFHASDRPRLLAETAKRLPHLDLPPAETASHLAVSTIWWRAFTEWSMRVARKYPERCFLYRHELMASHEDDVIGKLVSFLGFSSADVFRMGLSEPAGRKTTATYLLAADIGELYPHLRYYFEDCLSQHMPAQELQQLEDRLLKRYAGGRFSPQLAGDRLGRRSTLRLREDILGGHDVALKHVEPKLEDDKRVPLRARIEAHVAASGADVAALKMYARPPLVGTTRKTFGCCITSYNNRYTIRDAIYSALDQTRPFDRIVVVDDASRDGTPVILKDLEGRYSSLSIIYRTHNGGVSTARHQGIRALGTDYITHLDGDDCFWPTKNRDEAEVVLDDPDAVAFSRYLMDEGPDSLQVLDPSIYVGESAGLFRRLLARTPAIPRDMTMPAKAYRATGGYNARLGLYEDWDFKLRLTQVSGAWKVSDAHAGTVYNRRRIGLSSADAASHRRAITHIFLEAALRMPGQEGLADLYAQATRGFDDAMTTAMYSILLACDAGAASLGDLKPLLSRQGVAKAHEDFGLSVKAMDRSRRGSNKTIAWMPVEGFGNNQAPYPPIRRSEFYWQLEPSARLALRLFEPVQGLSIELFSPVRDNEITLELTDKSAVVFRGDFSIGRSERAGETLRPIIFPINVPLKSGNYGLTLKTKYFVEKAAAGPSVPARNLHVIVSDVLTADS